jgi:hypothetical protein
MFAQGITKQQYRERLLHKMHERLPKGASVSSSTTSCPSPNPTPTATPWLHSEDHEPLPYTAPNAHHHMSTAVRYPENISSWLGKHADDPAFKVSFGYYCHTLSDCDDFAVCRTFYHASRIIFLPAYLSANMTVMTLRLHPQNGTLLYSSITGFIDIKSFV